MKLSGCVAVTLLVASVFFGAHAWAEKESFSGDLFEKGSDRKVLLFKFRHEAESTGGVYQRAHNVFVDTEGHEALTEDIAYDAMGQLTKLVLDQKQTNEHGELEVREGKIYFSWTHDGKTKTASEKQPADLVVAATLVPYLQKNWEALVKGDRVDARFAALDRRETVGFKFLKTEEKKLNGRDAIVVKMKASSLIISAIVDPLYFVFDKETKRLMELTGRTAPKRLVKGAWKDLDAEIVYQY